MTAVRKAASLVILTPSKEILFMQRPAKGSFSSAHVFPGGVIEPSDPSPQHAAFRETYEETGLLIHPDLSSHPIAVPDTSISFEEALKKYPAPPGSHSGAVSHVSSWTTPITNKGKRFETDFFLYQSPLNSQNIGKLTGNSESLLLEWLTPTEALAKFDQGSIKLVPPQFYIVNSLLQLGPAGAIRKLENSTFKPHLEKVYPDGRLLMFWREREYGLLTGTNNVFTKIEVLREPPRL